MYDVQYHDGGSMQEEAIATYQHALSLALDKRQKTIDAGEETNRALNGIVDVNEEVTVDYTARSIDGIISALHTALGKVYFMSNMFEKAVESYNEAIKIEPLYLDAVSARGSSLIILGKYEEAATDFEMTIEKDSKRRFMDVFTGLARVLQAREGASTRGWDPMIRTMEELIIFLFNQYSRIQHPEGKAMVGTSLARLYHVLFIYHDSKTKDTDAAWRSLTSAYEYKMKSLPPWNAGFEAQKVQATKQIFHAGFWPDVGSSSDKPIFIIGFVRSGSTLLERILDAHPDIVGTGENSVFNGQLDEIRNQIVQTSMSGDSSALKDKVERLAEGVVTEMETRWDMVAASEDRAAGGHKPRKYVDKMLTNYYSKFALRGIEAISMCESSF
jgi:tetratricopeptide (TPR) repeat protein